MQDCPGPFEQPMKLSYFAGLTNREVAQAIRVFSATADRDLVFANAWLQAEMPRNDRE